jgi:hypothetical protein
LLLPLATFSAALSRFSIFQTLSIRLNHLPPLIPLSRVANIRSVHTLASVHPHRLGRMGWTSLPCLAIGTVSRSSNCELIFLTVPPSYPPWLHGRYPLHRYYGGSDSCLAPSCTKTGILDYQTRTSRHPVSNHPMRPIPGYASCSRSAWPPIRFVGYRRFFGLRASIAVSSVAYRPYRVCMTAPSRADQSTGCLFTSSCSPPHLAVTQLLSVFWREAPPGKDFHLPVRAFSQAHDRGL